MVLTKILPITNVRITRDELVGLLGFLTSIYTESNDSRARRYTLQIIHDEHTKSTIEDAPEDFEALLDNPIHRIFFQFILVEPDRSITLSLYNGNSPIDNQIEFAGDEDWVRKCEDSFRKWTRKLKPQPVPSNIVLMFSIVLVSLGIGWLILSQLMKIPIWTRSEPPTAEAATIQLPLLYTFVIFASFFTGIFPTFALFKYASGAYPSVEIQTGPGKDWLPVRRRKKLGWIFAIVVIAPLGNFFYDLYRSAF